MRQTNGRTDRQTELPCTVKLEWRGRITVMSVACRFAEIKWDKKKLEDYLIRFDELMKDNIVLEKVSRHQPNL